MQDMWRKPSAGDPLTFPASLRTKTIETIEYVDRLNRCQSPDRDRMAMARGIVRVKNESGSDMNRFEVLAIDGGVTGFSPDDDLTAWQNTPVLSGIEVAIPPVHWGQFAVMLEPLDEDEIGWGCVSGVVPVQVRFAYADSPYADLDILYHGDRLQADECGSARILDKQAGTGTLWALVRLGNMANTTIVGKLDADLAAGSTAAFSVWEGLGGVYPYIADTGRNVTVYSGALGSTLPAGAYSTAIWNGGVWFTGGIIEI